MNNNFELVTLEDLPIITDKEVMQTEEYKTLKAELEFDKCFSIVDNLEQLEIEDTIYYLVHNNDEFIPLLKYLSSDNENKEIFTGGWMESDYEFPLILYKDEKYIERLEEEHIEDLLKLIHFYRTYNKPCDS